MIPYIIGLVGGYLIGESMQSEKFANGGLIGKRVRLIEMKEDPDPVAPGTMGTIYHVGGGVINVEWDNGRRLGLVEGVDEYEITMADGGPIISMHNRIQEYQIKKPDGTYFYVKMSTGNPAWASSPDMGYLYTQEDAEKIKNQLEKEGVTGLTIVKYDKNWWKNQPKDEFAKGGKVKKKYAVLRSPMGEIIADVEVENEDKMEALKKFRDMGINEVGTIYFTETPPYYYADGGSTDTIATTILKQLGGAGRLNAMTGAYNFRDLGNGLAFKIKNQRANYIKITLNGLDLYDLEVGRIRGNDYKVVASHNDVYFDQLKPLIEKATGMYLSLFAKGGEIKWQDVETGDSARVKETNKTGVIMKAYGRKFHLKFVDGTEKTYDATELEFFKN